MKHVNSLSYGRVYICPTFTHFSVKQKRTHVHFVLNDTYSLLMEVNMLCFLF